LVPNVFSLGYIQVLNGFPICSPNSQMSSPTCSS
jgi:hypothetical protein